METKNKDKIDELTKDIKLIQKYRNRIKIIPEGKKTIGTGHTQPKLECLQKYHLW